MPEKMINVSLQESARAVEKVIHGLGQTRVNEAVGSYLSAMVAAHLVKYNAEHPNQLGGRRTNYYSKAADGTSYQETGDGITVSVKQVGIKLHYYGGTVTPGKYPSTRTGEPTQYLTIPAIAEAHGKSAKDIPNLSILYGRGGKPIGLVQGGKQRKNKKGAQSGGGLLFFWLVKSATIRPEPDIIPTNQELKTEAKRAITEMVEKFRL